MDTKKDWHGRPTDNLRDAYRPREGSWARAREQEIYLAIVQEQAEYAMAANGRLWPISWATCPEEEKEESMSLQWKIGDSRGNDMARVSDQNDGTVSLSLIRTMTREEFKSFAGKVMELYDIAEEEAE